MAELIIDPMWRVSLTHRELGLVLRALGGRLTTDDVALAVALGDKLTAYKATQMSELGRLSEGLTRALAEKQTGKVAG